MATEDFEQILEVIEKLSSRITLLRTELEHLSSSQAINARVARQLQRQISLINSYTTSLEQARTELGKLSAAQAGVNYISGGTGASDPDINSRFRQGRLTPDQIRRATTVTQAGLPGFGVTPVSSSTVPLSQNPWAETRAKIAEKQLEDAMTRSLSEREKIERQRLQVAKDMLKSEQRYKAVLDMASRQGFTLEDLKAIRTRGTGGIQQVQFQKYNELGVKQNLDIFSTPSGKATPGISNQFRTFGQGVVRDIGELTKWSLALAAVYGPLRKLGDLTQEMIDNQTRLADATITVNNAFIGQAEIFEIASDSANRSGEAISGVIDAFTQAYRATGGVGDNVTRLATAQKLLNDALILSKLSTLDQAQAIDTLAASVRQTGGDFDRTTQLLDSWVRVTKVANVDLATLATGFATLGDAAETAGLDANELNGLLAVIAESSNATGQEVANAARAIVAGLQSEKGVQALERLGIATKTTSGDMRNLQDILVEVSSLIDSGVINETQLARLGLDVGGGSRRGAIVTTVLSNYSRAIEVAGESARAGGDAQAALDKQLNTVQTDLTRLANAFTTLAQTMGGEGGFLTIIQGSVRGITGLVGMFDKLISLLGRATPALAAFIAASLVLKQQGIPSIQAWVGGLATTTAVPTGPGGQPFLPGFGPQLSRRQRFGNFASENILGTNAPSGAIQGLLLSALPAYLNWQNKDDRYGKTKATADVIGGLGGGVIGALVAGSPIIGAAVGTAISEAFVNATIARTVDIFAFSTAPSLGDTRYEDTPEGKEKRLEDSVSNIYRSIGFGNESIGKYLTSGYEKNSKELIEDLNDAIKRRDEGAFNRRLQYAEIAESPILKKLGEIGLDNQTIREAFQSGKEIQFKPEYIARAMAPIEAQREYDASLAAIKATQTGAEADNPFSKQVKANADAFTSLLSEIRERSKTELQQQRLGGDVTGAEYARRNQAIGGFDTKALQYYTAFGKEFQSINKDVTSATEAFEAFNTVIVSGAEESIPQLTQITGEISELYNILNDPKNQADLMKQFGFENLDEVRQKLQELKDAGAAVVSDIYEQTKLNQLNIPDVQGDITKPLSRDEYGLVTQTAKGLQDQFYQGFLDIPDEMYDSLKDSWDSWAQIIEDSGQVFYETVAGIDPQFFQQAMAQLMEQGKLASQAQNPFGIQQLDITSGQGAGLQGTIDYFSNYLAQNFPQYEQKPEEFGVIFSDYVTDVLHGDNLAVKLALEKLVDINQKQLDGMYNIPEGATFWVPLTAAYYRPKNEGGTGGLPSVDSQAVNTNTDALDRNSQVLDQLTQQLLGEKDYIPKAPEKNTPYHTPGGLEQRFRGEETGKTNYRLLGENLHSRTPITPSNREQPLSFFERFINELKTIFSRPAVGGPPGRGYGGGEGAIGANSASRSFASTTTTQPQQLSARLDLRFDNTTQLIVDGRILASIITPYLASDLVRLEASQGTITKRYVI